MNKEKAIELTPGCTYIIECSEHLSNTLRKRLLGRLEKEGSGEFNFIILDAGLKIAKENLK